uniref:beta-1,4-galactosyltransferase 2-like isoform X2 n=1 Tax=Myxine glutinosa TaxID=7769 RepID=UPI00359020CB
MRRSFLLGRFQAVPGPHSLLQNKQQQQRVVAATTIKDYSQLVACGRRLSSDLDKQDRAVSGRTSESWLPYTGYFGGVSGLSKVQFLKINGFPNNYWGWGGEDDDIYNRITLQGMKISRPDSNIGRYRMIKHHRDAKNEPNPKRFTQIHETRWTMKTDGLTSLKYQLVKKDVCPLYTNITVDVGKPPN